MFIAALVVDLVHAARNFLLLFRHIQVFYVAVGPLQSQGTGRAGGLPSSAADAPVLFAAAKWHRLEEQGPLNE